MFDSLSGKMTGVFDRLRTRGALSEADVAEAMREVRLAMLDSDVALPVVKDFINRVRERAIGAEVLESISPGQAVAKIVNDALVEALGGAGAVPLNLNAAAPVPILMVGLQGSGKTTTAGKLGLRLGGRERRRVLLASLDTQRPAAQLQLAQLAQRAGVASLPIVAGQTPVQIAQRAMETGRREGYDIVILDTAGRLSIDEALMEEVRQIRAVTNPAETLLVVDAMTGQDAVNTARAFNEAVGVTGIVMTRMDGDARGGAALSMRHITGAPIKLTGSGEKLDALEDFHPERVAGRILGLGDLAGLVEKASDTLDAEESEKLALKMLRGKFDLDDYAAQIKQINKMGFDFRHPRHAAGHGPDEEPARRQGSRYVGAEASHGDHLVHDQGRTAHARHHQGEPQEAYRGGIGCHRAGDQPPAQAVRRHVDDDEAHQQARRQGTDAPGPGSADAEGHDAPGRTGWRAWSRPASALITVS